jgi:hypothetical protein
MFKSMDTLSLFKSQIRVLIEQQLKEKKREYQKAIKDGIIFRELKEIFLEIKRLEKQLQNILYLNREQPQLV